MILSVGDEEGVCGVSVMWVHTSPRCTVSLHTHQLAGDQLLTQSVHDLENGDQFCIKDRRYVIYALHVLFSIYSSVQKFVHPQQKKMVIFLYGVFFIATVQSDNL